MAPDDRRLNDVPIDGDEVKFGSRLMFTRYRPLLSVVSSNPAAPVDGALTNSTRRGQSLTRPLVTVTTSSSVLEPSTVPSGAVTCTWYSPSGSPTGSDGWGPPERCTSSGESNRAKVGSLQSAPVVMRTPVAIRDASTDTGSDVGSDCSLSPTEHAASTSAEVTIAANQTLRRESCRYRPPSGTNVPGL